MNFTSRTFPFYSFIWVCSFIWNLRVQTHFEARICMSFSSPWLIPKIEQTSVFLTNPFIWGKSVLEIRIHIMFMGPSINNKTISQGGCRMVWYHLDGQKYSEPAKQIYLIVRGTQSCFVSKSMYITGTVEGCFGLWSDQSYVIKSPP